MSGMSRVSRSPTLMPSGATSTSPARRSLHFTAISAAIQPPSDEPITTTSRSVPLGEKVEIEIGQVVDGVDARHVGRMAEAGMRGREHAAVGGQQVEERRARIEAFLAVEPEDRAPLPALDDLELHAADYS